jgi:hypothetical protein
MTSAQKSSIKRKQQGRRFVMTQELMGHSAIRYRIKEIYQRMEMLVNRSKPSSGTCEVSSSSITP